MKAVLKAMVSQINKIRKADRGPEKAGVGGSIPSLATVLKLILFQTFTHIRVDGQAV